MTSRRFKGLPASWLRGAVTLSVAAFALAVGRTSTQDAIANGDTRTISIVHEHTKESASITFRRNGYYDATALRQLNWLLRDWRTDESTQMDPRLFDIVWQVQRDAGARQPIHVVSAYRSPGTNAALRRRSRRVAQHSQHMLGKAMDFYIPDSSMARVREIAMKLQHGGVGFYPSAFNPFVHLDSAGVRSWPRMSPAQLARLFPDGKTVHIPRNGKPLRGYEEARAAILARGGTVAGFGLAQADEGPGARRPSLWATLFGGRDDDEDADYYRQTRPAASTGASAYATSNSNDAGARSFYTAAAAAPPAPARLAAPAPAPAPPATAEPEPEPVPAGEAAATSPLPPRRPADKVRLASASLDGLAPPSVAAPSPPRGEMRSAPSAASGDDDRAALKSLFETVATKSVASRKEEVRTVRARPEPVEAVRELALRGGPGRTRFSSADVDEPRPDAFRPTRPPPRPSR